MKQATVFSRLHNRILSAACAAFLCCAAAFGAVSCKKYNATDRIYEAKHQSFSSIEEAEAVLGKDYLLSKLNVSGKTGITLGFSEEGALHQKDKWTELECRIENSDEVVGLFIYFADPIDPASFGGESFGGETGSLVVGNTKVDYIIYDNDKYRDGKYGDLQYTVIAFFTYDDLFYVFQYASDVSPERATDLLHQLLDG